MEIWKNIKGYDDYKISTVGNVMSTKFNKEKILKARKDKCGRLLVSLSKNGKYTNKKVHRLVAEAFIPNPDNMPIVRHLNDIPNDNRVENLAWGTQKDNMQDAVRNGSYDNISNIRKMKKSLSEHLS